MPMQVPKTDLPYAPDGGEGAVPEHTPQATGAERRTRSRFALMLRSAKLLGDDGEYLCIVRDVSETGTKLKLFHPLPSATRYALELSEGGRYDVELAWSSELEAGFRFCKPVDAKAFIAESGPFPKRPIRLSVCHPVTLVTDTGSMEATLRDISRQGACIESRQKLAIGQRLILKGDILPTFEATVCWRREPSYGLVFSQLMGLEDLATRAFAIQKSEQDRGLSAR
jgi:hypothetical protein